MKYNFLFCVHTSFFIFYSFLQYPFSVSLSSVPLHLFFLPHHRPFFLPHHRPTDPSFFLRDPSPICMSPAATDPSPSTHVRPLTWPISASILYFRRFGFVYRAVLVFRLCVSALCIGLACVSDLCFGLGGFVFWAWVLVCGFDVWVTRFGFGGFRCLAMGFSVWLWLILWLRVCFMVCYGFVGAAVLVLGGGRAAFFIFIFYFVRDWWFCLVRKKIGDLCWFFFFFSFPDGGGGGGCCCGYGGGCGWW